MSDVRQKISKDKARYRRGAKSKECSQCTMFRAPSSCTLVKGDISEHGVCDYFRRKDSRWRAGDM